MLELMRKTYLIGLGLANMTREKIEELVDDLVKRGEIAEKDRRSVMNDLMDRAKEEQSRLSQTVKETARKVVKEMGVPTRDQYDDLLARLKRLEQQLQKKKSGDAKTTENA